MVPDRYVSIKKKLDEAIISEVQDANDKNEKHPMVYSCLMSALVATLTAAALAEAATLQLNEEERREFMDMTIGALKEYVRVSLEGKRLGGGEKKSTVDFETHVKDIIDGLRNQKKEE